MLLILVYDSYAAWIIATHCITSQYHFYTTSVVSMHNSSLRGPQSIPSPISALNSSIVKKFFRHIQPSLERFS